MGLKLPLDLQRKILELASEPVVRTQWHHHCEAGVLAVPAISEKEFQAAVVALARRHGWLCFHPFDSRRSEAGFPDLVMVRPPRLVFAELKSVTGRVTPAQQMWVDCLKAVPGVEVHVWLPANWPAIVRTLL
jgi:hypothetical protein